MRQENPLNPLCPKCSSNLKRNGRKNGKTRFRCSRCRYNETENSTAHNSNKRTFPFGYTQLKNLRPLVRTCSSHGSESSNPTVSEQTVKDVNTRQTEPFTVRLLNDSEKNSSTTREREIVNHAKLN